MENRSAPEPHSDDRSALGRPPGLEFTMGTALFGLSVMVFFLAQTIAFVHGLLARTPELAGAPLSFSLLEDPLFQQRMKDLAFNGDMVGAESAWSGGIGALFILLVCALWKRRWAAPFLGLRLPSIGQLALWLAVFAGVIGLIEGLGRISPAFRTDFMEQVVGSATDRGLLVLGVAILGPLFEELLLRGLLYGTVRHVADEHVSVAVTAGVFALMHLQYSLPVMLLIVPMGVALGYARARSGSLLVPIAMHMLNNGMSIIWP